MAFLGLFGANATGKTTTLRKFWDELEKYEFQEGVRFTIIHADNNNAEYRYDDGILTIKERTTGRSSRWGGKAKVKHALVRDCVADDGRIYLVESCRFSDVHSGVANAYLECEGGVQIVFVTLDWKTMRLFLQQRCEARGKTFNVGYWTPNMLAYEGLRRPVNQARKYLDPAKVPYTLFNIDEQRANWHDVMLHIVSLLNKPIGGWYGVNSCANQRIQRKRKDDNSQGSPEPRRRRQCRRV